MDGKKSPTIKPSEFSNDLIVRSEKILAEAREQLRVEEKKQTNIEKQNREYLAWVHKDSEERRKRSREFSAKLDKEWEEGSIQRREFQAKVHKLAMTALSLDEIELTEALAAKTKRGKAPRELKDAKPATKPPPTTVANGGDKKDQINTFITKVLTEKGRKITRKDIWTVAGYKDKSDFARFQRGDTKTTKAAAIAFNRVLNMNPDDFMRFLENKLAAK